MRFSKTWVFSLYLKHVSKAQTGFLDEAELETINRLCPRCELRRQL